jgi:hypothetical protein
VRHRGYSVLPTVLTVDKYLRRVGHITWTSGEESSQQQDQPVQRPWGSRIPECLGIHRDQ